MKASGLMIGLLLLSVAVKADMIYVPHLEGTGAALSLEAGAGLEKPFTKHHSAAIVGVLGAVSMAREILAPATKAQMGIEVKHYFMKNTFSGFNLGLNAALASERFPLMVGNQVIGHNNYVGFVPAVKFSYLKNLNSSFQLEPYVEASTPWYSNKLSTVFKSISNGHDPNLIMTFGLRVKFNHVLKKESND